ncbi:uncharacterized protein [Macrobrachium rosenbergii]|uniref:uncharacterized protein isoform X6 n=1 Tax=Macrobrachium rosenbergii TaxID=79674 RepID=UPI0034D45C3A
MKHIPRFQSTQITGISSVWYYVTALNMAGRLVIEVKQSVSIKYPRDSDDGKNVTQPVALTPQNGALAKEPVPNISRLPAVRTSSCQLEVPLTRTPKIVEVKSLSVTLQVSKPSANNSPVVSETQVARSYGSNTPVMRSSMDNTSPSAKLKCTSKDEMPHVLPVMTPKSDQLAPRGSKENIIDQISNIDANLPYDTKVSHLIDISLREALRRLEEECKTDECLEDVRLDLITNSERIGSCTSYKVVDECKSRKKIDSTLQSTDEVADIKNKIKKLEEEYKCWKSLLKKRKRACLSAKRKFHEARSGEIKIEDDCKNKLTCEQQSILATRPDYCQYMKEVQMAQEKVFFIMQEVNHTTNLFSSFLMASKAVGDSCYFAIEEMFLGTVKSQPLKCSFETLMKLGDSPLS